MASEQYRCWVPEFGDLEEDCSLEMAHDHETAARQYAGKLYNEEPFDCDIVVHVRCTFGGNDGELKRFTINAEPTVEFFSFEVQQ